MTSGLGKNKVVYIGLVVFLTERVGSTPQTEIPILFIKVFWTGV